MAPTRASTERAAAPARKAAMPLFTPISAPVLSSFAYDKLVKWKEERDKYVDLVKQHCKSSSVPTETMLISVIDSCDRHALKTACEYRWNIEFENVDD